MANVTVAFSCDTERDKIILSWLEVLAEKGVNKSGKIRQAIMAHLNSQMWTIGDIMAEMEAIKSYLYMNIQPFPEFDNSQGVHIQPQKKTPHSGYVYVMASDDGTYYKIGLSVSPSQRLDQVSPMMPFDVTLLFVIKSDDMFSLESDLHQRFKDKRCKGEWFKLTQDDIELIKRDYQTFDKTEF